MHELALMACMMEIILGEARSQGFSKVSKVVLEIGEMAGVEPEAMRFAFDVSSCGTLAAGAELAIEQPEGLVQCLDCLRTAPVRKVLGCCPHCAGTRLEVVAGKEMRLKFLEVD